MTKDSGPIEALRKYAAGSGLDEEDHEAANRELNAESDRAAIILAVSYLDDGLGWALRLSMEMTDDVKLKEIFKPSGVLGDFSSRIRLAEAFGLITAHEAQTSDDMRIIRNACAHCRKPITLDVQKLRNAVIRALKNTDHSKYSDHANNSVLRTAFVNTAFDLALKAIKKAGELQERRQRTLLGKLLLQSSGKGLLGGVLQPRDAKPD